MPEDKERGEALRREMLAPHIALAGRKVLGCPQGKLVCEHCGAQSASHNRQGCAYHGSDNMATLCVECQEEADAHWAELWDTYRADCF